MIYPIGFYVYRLLDPRSGLPFYVGKGQRDRGWTHERLVRSGNFAGNRRKVAAIQAILERGESVEVEIVASYDLEADALDHEFRLVDASPTLTNVMPGGGGGGLCAKEVARRAAVRAHLKRRAMERDRRERERVERAAKRAKYLSRARNDAERRQIAAWLDTMDEAAAARLLTPVAAADATREAKRAKKPNRRSGRRRGLYRKGQMHDMPSSEVAARSEP